MTIVNWKDKQLVEEAVKSSTDYRDTLRKLNLQSKGGNANTLKKWIAEHNIDASHFDPKAKQIDASNRWRAKITIPLKEILNGRHPQYKTYHLKCRLIREGIKQNVCEECGQDGIWNGKDLHIQLDHINGISTDHRTENLKMLCPNCHSQTATFAGKKNKNRHKQKYAGGQHGVEAAFQAVAKAQRVRFSSPAPKLD